MSNSSILVFIAIFLGAVLISATLLYFFLMKRKDSQPHSGKLSYYNIINNLFILHSQAKQELLILKSQDSLLNNNENLIELIRIQEKICKFYGELLSKLDNDMKPTDFLKTIEEHINNLLKLNENE